MQRLAGESHLIFNFLVLRLEGLLRQIKQHLRRHALAKGKQLTSYQKDLFSKKISASLLKTSAFVQAHKIAFYYPLPNEVSLLPLMAHALNLQKCCYLPVVSGQTLHFAQITQQTQLTQSRWGIFEPQNSPLIDPRVLDLVLVPLVAFDAHCHRLGRGKGYYDRCFAFRVHCNKPQLIGVSFEIQRVTQVPKNKLDLVLDGVVTERGSYLPKV